MKTEADKALTYIEKDETQMNADAQVPHPLRVTAYAYEITSAPDPVYYTYSSIFWKRVVNAQRYEEPTTEVSEVSEITEN